MLKLPWMLKFERRPRPLPQEFQDLVSMVDQLATVVGEVRKMAEATQRKVYRDIDKDNGPERVEMAPPREPLNASVEWRTGDPEP